MPGFFNEDWLISSPDYSAVMESTVLPELDRIRNDCLIQGKNSMPLFTSVFKADHPAGTVLILHGFTENSFKYSELIYSFVRSGLSVVIYDQRGHGRSGRAENLPDPSVTHVDCFEDYVDDLRIVCDTLLCNMPKPWTLFAHSMGGAVASLFLEKYHDVFSAASLCAPMIAPNINGVPAGVASALCRFFCGIGKARSFPFFMKPYSGPEDFNTSCATDPVRFAWYNRIKDSHIEYRNSIPSYRWVQESVSVTRKILAQGAPESINCPVLLSSADQDFSVLPEPQKSFIDRIPDGERIFVESSRHEIFRSVNEVLFPWWHTVLLFLKGVKA